MAVAAIHLRVHRMSVWKLHGGPGADGGAIMNAESESEKLARIRTFIVHENRWLPLIRNRIIQPAIAIYVGNSDAAADVTLAQSDLARKIVITAVGGPHEERIMIVAA